MSINTNTPPEGTPTKPTEVDPETKTDAEGKPVENPSG